MEDLEKLVKELNEEKVKYHIDVHGKIYKQKGIKGHAEHVKESSEKGKESI